MLHVSTFSSTRIRFQRMRVIPSSVLSGSLSLHAISLFWLFLRFSYSPHTETARTVVVGGNEGLKKTKIQSVKSDDFHTRSCGRHSWGWGWVQIILATEIESVIRGSSCKKLAIFSLQHHRLFNKPTSVRAEGGDLLILQSPAAVPTHHPHFPLNPFLQLVFGLDCVS